VEENEIFKGPSGRCEVGCEFVLWIITPMGQCPGSCYPSVDQIIPESLGELDQS
jgi:hypothetical protein